MIFVDFDGTLVDVSLRYYRVHEASLSQVKPRISAQQYWNFKREQVSEREIVAQWYPDIDEEEYRRRRSVLLEDREFLRFDSLLPHALHALQALRQANHDLVLVSLRRREDYLLDEVESLGIRPLFGAVLTATSPFEPWNTKAGLIGPLAKPGAWVVGDTEADIKAGQLLGLRTCAVESGIRTPAYLTSLTPTLVVKDIGQFVLAVNS